MARRTEVAAEAGGRRRRVGLRVGRQRLDGPSRAADNPHNGPMSVYEVHLGLVAAGPELPRPRRAPRQLRQGPRLHPRRAAARDGAPLRPVVGLPGHGLLRADVAVRHAGRLPLPRRPPAPDRDRRHPRLGARPLRHRRVGPRPLRRPAALRAPGPPARGGTPSGARTSSTSAVRRCATSSSPTRCTGSRSSTSTACASTASRRCSTSTTRARTASGSRTSYGGRENLEAVQLLQEANATAYKRVPGIVTIAEESTSWPGVTAPTDQGGLGLRAQVEHGLDERHPALPRPGADPPAVPPQPDDLLADVRVQRELRAADQPRRGRARQGLAPAQDPAATRGEQLATLRAFLAYMWSPPRQAAACSWAASSPRSRSGRTGRSLDWWLLDQPAHYRVHALVKDLNRIYRDHPAMWELDNDPAGFRWLDADDASRQHLRVPALRLGVTCRVTRRCMAVVINFSGDDHTSRSASGVPRARAVEGHPRHQPATTARARRARPGSSSWPSAVRGTTSRTSVNVTVPRHWLAVWLVHRRSGTVMNAPARRTAGAALGPRRRRRPRDGVLHARARPDEPRRAGRVRHLGPPRVEPEDRVQRGAHPRDDPGDLRVPRAQQGFDGPLFMGRDTHGLSEPAWDSALEVLVANDVTVLVDSPTATPRPRRCHTRSSPSTAARPAPDRAPGSPTASSSRRRTTHPPTAGSSTTRPTAARPTRTRRRSSRHAANELIRDGLGGVRRVPLRQAPGEIGDATTSWARYVDDLPASSTSRRSARPACGSAPTRWAAPRSRTGARSANGTGWTSPS